MNLLCAWWKWATQIHGCPSKYCLVCLFVCGVEIADDRWKLSFVGIAKKERKKYEEDEDVNEEEEEPFADMNEPFPLSCFLL